MRDDVEQAKVDRLLDEKTRVLLSIEMECLFEIYQNSSKGVAIQPRLERFSCAENEGPRLCLATTFFLDSKIVQPRLFQPGIRREPKFRRVLTVQASAIPLHPVLLKPDQVPPQGALFLRDQ